MIAGLMLTQYFYTHLIFFNSEQPARTV